MWYVNVNTLISMSLLFLSFILTMWYVNLVDASVYAELETSFILKLKFSPFYINYVVCKSESY